MNRFWVKRQGEFKLQTFITVYESSQYWSVDEKTVRNWISLGMPSVQLGDDRNMIYMVPVVHAGQWLASQRRIGTVHKAPSRPRG
jgi:hypothetical protein